MAARFIYCKKNLLLAVLLVVSIPRLSHYSGRGDKATNKLFNNIFNAPIVVVAPLWWDCLPSAGRLSLYFRESYRMR